MFFFFLLTLTYSFLASLYSSFLLCFNFLFIVIYTLSHSFFALLRFLLNHVFSFFFYFIKWNVLLDSSFIYHQEEIIYPLHIFYLIYSCLISFIFKNLFQYSVLYHNSSFSFHMIPPAFLPYLLLSSQLPGPHVHYFQRSTHNLYFFLD